MKLQDSAAQETYVCEQVDSQLEKLCEEIFTIIERAVAEVNENLEEKGIFFDGDYIVSSGYFTAVVHERIFDKLHGGNLQLAKTILDMNARRTGLQITFK